MQHLPLSVEFGDQRNARISGRWGISRVRYNFLCFGYIGF